MKKIILALLTAVIIVSCMALVSLHNEGEQDVTAYAAGSAKVCGVLSYEYSDGNGGILTAPLRNVKVVLWDKNVLVDDRIAETYTDANGYYEFVFANGSFLDNQNDVYIRYFAGGRTFSLLNIDNMISFKPSTIFDPNDVYFSYFIEEKVRRNVEDGSTTVINSVVECNDASLYKAFYISQTLAAAEEFMGDCADGTIDGKVYIFYPMPIVDKVVSLLDWISDIASKLNASLVTEEIEHISEMVNRVTSFCYDRFMCLKSADWDNYITVLHEYGHFVEWRRDTYGPHTKQMLWKHWTGHAINEDAVAKQGKEFGMDLAWSEGWASAFALLALQYAEWLQDIPGVNTSLDEEIEIYFPYKDDYDNSGEAQEYTITAMLIDWYADYIDKPQDRLTLGYDEFFRTSAKAGVYTTSDFVSNLYEEYPQYMYEIGEMLGRYKIAPAGVSLSEYHLYAPPTITWIGNGSMGNPNNRFRIMAFDDDGNNLWTSNERLREQIDATKTVGSCSHSTDELCRNCRFEYTFTNEEWRGLIDAFAGENSRIHIAVAGYVNTWVERIIGSNSYYYKSGPYISASVCIDDYFPLFKEGNYYYTTREKDSVVRSTIIGYDLLVRDSITSLAIPASIGGTQVEAIGDYAFFDCEKLATISLPAGLTGIGLDAFDGTAYVENAANGAVILGDWVIAYKSSNGTTVVLPDNIVGIAGGAFRDVNLTAITLNDGLKYICAEAFLRAGLSNLTLPDSVVRVEMHAFMGCSFSGGLEFLSTSPPYIGDYAINSFSSISIYVPYLSQEAYKEALLPFGLDDNVTSLEITVSFEPSNGTNVSDATYYYYSVLGDLPVVSKTGYVLVGWYDNEDFNGAAYSEGTILKCRDSITLYARWSPISYTIILVITAAIRFPILQFIRLKIISVCSLPKKRVTTLRVGMTEQPIFRKSPIVRAILNWKRYGRRKNIP